MSHSLFTVQCVILSRAAFSLGVPVFSATLYNFVVYVLTN